MARRLERASVRNARRCGAAARWASLGTTARVRRNHDARRRVDGALERRALRATAPACPRGDANDASRSLSGTSRRPGSSRRRSGATSPRSAPRATRKAPPPADAERLVLILAAPGRGRGRARRAPGWPSPRGAPWTCWTGVRVVDATRSHRWARRCVEARHASNGVFNTSYEIRLLFRPLSAEDLPVRDLETFTPANESRIRRLVSRAKNISFSSGYSPSEKCSRSVCCLAFDGAASARGGPSANRDAAADPSSALSLPPFTPIPSVHSPFGVRESPECVGDFGFGGF